MKIESIRNCCGYPVATLNGGVLNCYRRYERIYFIAGGNFHYSTGRYTARQETDHDNIKKLKQWFLDQLTFKAA
jgi:hypothetical protein